MPAYRTKIAGVTFPNEDGGSRQALLRVLKAGDTVTLKRSWLNDHDPNAIEVHSAEGQIGHIPRNLAAKLANEMDFEPEATVVSVHGGTPKAPTLGAEIVINAWSRS